MTATQTHTPRSEFGSGVRDQLPLLLGVIPFGLIFGALAVSVGIPPLAAQGFSVFIFAGSAQFIAASLVGELVAPVIVILTIFVVNLRHALYSASLGPHMDHLSGRWKLALSWLLTDEAFAVASTRYRRGSLAQAHWYTLGAGMALWATWQISTALGIALGARVPADISLDFALPLTFLALLVPALVNRPTVMAALSAGVLAVMLHGLPLRLGLLIGASVGVGVGTLLHRNRAND
jgi:4-azaleucine resistance transporter AzlC